MSWSVFARNLLLAAIATLIVVFGKDDPGLSAFNWLGPLKPMEVVNFILAVIAIGLLVPTLILLRRALAQQATVLEKVEAIKKVIDEDYAEPAPVARADAAPPAEGLPVGAIAPQFSLPTPNGQQTSLDDLLAFGKSVLLLFVSPNCSPCKSLLPFVRVWQRDYADHLTVALLSNGSEKEVQTKMAKYEVEHLLLVGESSVSDEYQAKWTPAALLIDRRGKIASAVAVGEEAIRSLVASVGSVGGTHAIGRNGTHGRGLPEKADPSLFRIGESAPKFSLPDMRGREVSSDSLLGDDILLLFWNPSCGFCKAMAEEIKRWEVNPPKGAPRIIFIFSGDAAEVEAESERFKSISLYDQEFDIGPMFGAYGTPSGVLIDAEGRISSGVALGERNILPLLGIRKNRPTHWL